MIDITQFIEDSLKNIGVPVAFQALPTGAKIPDAYITFLEINSKPSLETADAENITERLIQVNVWSKSNYHTLVTNVRNALENVGFERTFEFDAPYSDGDSHFNKVLRFSYLDEF